MLHASTDAATRRQRLRDGLRSGRLQRFPGAYSPLVALAVSELRFDGIYVSGGALAADLGLPDVGLTTMSEVTERAHRIARVSDLPAIVDIDTGFGGPLNVARTVQVLEDLGLAGCHVEDQVNPKRCGHLEGKGVVSTEEMVRRVRAAVNARRDPGFAICARTDARAVEGLDATIERAKAYVDAGADLVFPEALADEGEFERVRAAIAVPLIANMTEFGRSPLLSYDTLDQLGMNIVIYPVTLLRVAMGAVEKALSTILAEGSQAGLVEGMQTRARLYELLDYHAYAEFDVDVANFGFERAT